MVFIKQEPIDNIGNISTHTPSVIIAKPKRTNDETEENGNYISSKKLKTSSDNKIEINSDLSTFSENEYRNGCEYFWYNNIQIKLNLNDNFPSSPKKNRNTYEITLGMEYEGKPDSNVSNDLDEFIEVHKLFDSGVNIMGISNTNFRVVDNRFNNSFYVKNVQTLQIYRCAYNEIAHIYDLTHEPTFSSFLIENVKSKNFTGERRGFKYETDKIILDKKKLDIGLFEAFINCEFNIVDTIVNLTDYSKTTKK